MTKQLLQQAIDAMQTRSMDATGAWVPRDDLVDAAIEALRAAIAAPEPEPVAKRVMPTLVVGQVYQTHNHGPAVFDGIDVYYGQSTYQFTAGRERVYCMLDDYAFFEQPALPDTEALRAEIASLEPIGHLYTVAGVQHCSITQVAPDGPLYTSLPDAETLRKELEQIKEEQRLLHRGWFGHRDTGHLTFTEAVEKTMGDLYDELERVKGEQDAMALDLKRMDFLDYCVMEHRCISAERDYDPHISSPTFGNLKTVSIFTIPSQHVKGIGLRSAIDAAIAKSRNR